MVLQSRRLCIRSAPNHNLIALVVQASGRRASNLDIVLRPQPDLYTVDEFYDVVPEGQKADLIDGVIYMASPDTMQADDLNGFVLALLRIYTRARNLGKVTGSRFAYRLTEFRAPEPDVAFVSRERVAAILTPREGVGPPDIAVEIVARDSKTRDYGEKKTLYEQSGVREYWIIDPLVKRAEFWSLTPQGYQLIPLEQNRIFQSTALPGFWLDVNWLFAEELPDDHTCLLQILNG